MSSDDDEQNRLSERLKRYASVGTNVGGIAARIAGARLFGRASDRGRNASDLAAALGGLKGPIMKVAQMLSTIPEALPAEYAAELSQLQSHAPPMGYPFVKRRMAAELGADWQQKFRDFEPVAAASASLGQVHRAISHDGALLAAKLQYPDMQSAVEADLAQLGVIFAIHRRMDPAIETSEMLVEIAERLREELDYEREAAHLRLYGAIFAGDALVRVPTVFPALSTKRLLTMSWAEGRKLLDYRAAPLEHRNQLARAMFRAWWHPFSHFGVIHGDPHLGNYSVFAADRPNGGADTGRRLRVVSTCWTTAASACSRQNLSAGWSTFTAASPPTIARWWCTPTRPGALPDFQRTDRNPQPLGGLQRLEDHREQQIIGDKRAFAADQLELAAFADRPDPQAEQGKRATDIDGKQRQDERAALGIDGKGMHTRQNAGADQKSADHRHRECDHREHDCPCAQTVSRCQHGD